MSVSYARIDLHITTINDHIVGAKVSKKVTKALAVLLRYPPSVMMDAWIGRVSLS
jgi:hypothetical protein